MIRRLDNQRPSARVSRLTEQLEKKYGLPLAIDSIEHLKIVQEHYRSKKNHLLHRYGVAEAVQRADYMKSVLISETVSIILREISPSRMRKRTVSRKDRK